MQLFDTQHIFGPAGCENCIPQKHAPCPCPITLKNPDGVFAMAIS
jgi:hypothetical protein